MLYEIEEYMSPILEFLEHADDTGMKTAFQVPFGSGGPPEYYYRLCSMVKRSILIFNQKECRTGKPSNQRKRSKLQIRKIRELIVEMQKFIFDSISRNPWGGKAYWDKGVADKNIKVKAYARSLDNVGSGCHLKPILM